MPRHAREKSNSGIYHLVLRGINRQDIFNDTEDRQKYLAMLEKYKEKSGFEVYGFCLMSNHIHLLIKEGNESISESMRRMGSSYAYWYNQKYERCGHLFQGRFRSETVEDDRYLLVVLRYIHQNPIKAGIVKDPVLYDWTSYRDYLFKRSSLTDVRFILEIFRDKDKKPMELFQKFMKEKNDDQCLDEEERKVKRISDIEAKSLIVKLANSNSPKGLQDLSKKERNGIIVKLKESGVSIRQVAKLTGLGKRVIEKAR